MIELGPKNSNTGYSTGDRDRPRSLALVGHGDYPIPPTGWGAVESVIWEYAQRLRLRGNHCEIVNGPLSQVAPHLLRLHRQRPLDWVWVHYEKAVLPALLASRLCGFRVAVTGHAPYDALSGQPRPMRRSVARLALAKYQLCLTRELALGLTLRNPKAIAVVQPNGVSVEAFRWGPRGNGRAICVGRISDRKRQFRIAELTNDSGIAIDFVGPSDVGPVPTQEPSRYLGEWTREELSQRLTEYSVLVLYSGAEAHPLVILEALAAGLAVVVSPQSAGNLDTSRPFVHVVTRDEDLVSTLHAALKTSDGLRESARDYVAEHFDWDDLAGHLIAQLDAWDRAAANSSKTA